MNISLQLAMQINETYPIVKQSLVVDGKKLIIKQQYINTYLTMSFVYTCF